jgi:hypothetical protein
MSSATALDCADQAQGTPTTHDLLVLWQHPETRRITAIGRFGFDGTNYTFSYTRAAASIEGFRRLPGLAISRRYVSPNLPAAFEQRVMDPERSDYASYVQSLGLDPAMATPWEQIVESGGNRQGDTLQFMQVPTVENGRVRARFFANGVRHIARSELTVEGRKVPVSAAQQEDALRGLHPGSFLRLEAEDENSEDPCATLITSDGTPVGWVPRVLSGSIRELMDARSISVKVVRIGEPDTPPHLRLVLDLNVEAPPGFEFDRDKQWEPAPVQ